MSTTEETPDNDALDEAVEELLDAGLTGEGSTLPEEPEEPEARAAELRGSSSPGGAPGDWLVVACATVGLLTLTTLASLGVAPASIPVDWIGPAAVGLLGLQAVLALRASQRRERTTARQARESLASLAEPPDENAASRENAAPPGPFADAWEAASRRIDACRREERDELERKFRRDLTRLRSECERLVEKHAETAIEEKRAVQKQLGDLQTAREEDGRRQELERRERDERERAAEAVARDLRERVAELEGALAARGDENAKLVHELERGAEERERLRLQGVRYFDRIAAQLRGSVQIVRRLVDEIPAESSSDREKGAVVEIRDRLERLEHVIEEVIEFCKLESSSVSFVYSELDLPKALRKWVGEQHEEAKKRGVKVSLDLPEGLPSVLTDVRLVGKVVRELLANAIRFTPARGRVKVTAAVSEEGNAEAPCADGALRIAVTDTGPGIRDQDRERIFRPFERGGEPRYTLSDASAGLGLTLARGYARLLQGTVELDEARKDGSVFSTVVPVKVCSRVEY